MNIYIINKNNMRIHIPPKLLNNWRKLTLETIIAKMRINNNTPVMINAVDQVLTLRKMATRKRIIKKILFLGSNLWVIVLNGAYLPNVKSFICDAPLVE